MHTVAAVAAPGFSPFEMAVACEVFGLKRPELGVPWYEFKVCGSEQGAIPSKMGFSVTTAHSLEDLAAADTLIAPSWDADRPVPDGIVDAFASAYARGARVVSYCSGAFVLAAAGLLDGRTVTTHWMWARTLAEQYPSVRVDPDVLFVDDDRVLTSAGTAAAIDLSLHIVRTDYGAEIANMVARRMVVPPIREGGQSQFVETPLPNVPNTDPLAATMDWMLANLGEDMSLRDFAMHAHMSPRTFLRRFRESTGASPHRWLQQQRIQFARRLLETTEQPVERIAELSGLGSPASLRAHFRRTVGRSPSAYRRTFREVASAG